jgi:hypothetical protein
VIEVLDAMQDQLDSLSRLNGRLEAAAELQEWMLRNKARLPQWAIDELSALIVAVTAPTPTPRGTRH